MGRTLAPSIAGSRRVRREGRNKTLAGRGCGSCAVLSGVCQLRVGGERCERSGGAGRGVWCFVGFWSSAGVTAVPER
eukprot:2053461-Prymnesium_polylepis.1